MFKKVFSTLRASTQEDSRPKGETGEGTSKSSDMPHHSTSHRRESELQVPTVICTAQPEDSDRFSQNDETDETGVVVMKCNNNESAQSPSRLDVNSRKDCSRSASAPSTCLDAVTLIQTSSNPNLEEEMKEKLTISIQNNNDTSRKHLSPVNCGSTMGELGSPKVRSAGVHTKINVNGEGWFPFAFGVGGGVGSEFAKSTGCLNWVGVSRDGDISPIDALHPAVSNTNLASTKLRPLPVVGKSGELFEHPAVAVPLVLKDHDTIVRSSSCRRSKRRRSERVKTKSDRPVPQENRIRNGPDGTRRGKLERQRSMVELIFLSEEGSGSAGNRNSASSKSSIGCMRKRHSFGTKDELKRSSVDEFLKKTSTTQSIKRNRLPPLLGQPRMKEVLYTKNFANNAQYLDNAKPESILTEQRKRFATIEDAVRYEQIEARFAIDSFQRNNTLPAMSTAVENASCGSMMPD